MRATVFPTKIAGTVHANPSKSHAQRAIAISALAKGMSTLSGVGKSADTKVSMNIARKLGAQINENGDHVVIDGGHTLLDSVWDCNESGLALRMFSAIAGLFKEELILTGSASLTKRPVDFVVDGLQALGVRVVSNNGHIPISISGPISRSSVTIDGSTSSQFLSGLLIALPVTDHDTELHVGNLVSKPYIDITLEIIRRFGVQVTHHEYKYFNIRGKQHYIPIEYSIPGDWSGMSILMVGAAIAGKVIVKGLDLPSTQPDSRVIQLLEGAGVRVGMSQDGFTISESIPRPFQFDATDSPDLIPALVPLAACSPGRSTILGANRLRVKESNRAAALQTEYQKLGINVVDNGNLLEIDGGQIHGGVVSSHGDHRIAMSLAIAGLAASGAVEINDAECVSKSYPAFFEDLESLGARIRLSH